MKTLYKDKFIWAISLITISIIALMVYTPVNSVLKFEALTFAQMGAVVLLSFAGVMWYEVVKWFERRRKRV
jgi:Ca2+-transporting ATPase